MADLPSTHPSAMQLFYELKHKFPAVPDAIVSQCIQQNPHDPGRCESLLYQTNQSFTSQLSSHEGDEVNIGGRGSWGTSHQQSSINMFVGNTQHQEPMSTSAISSTGHPYPNPFQSQSGIETPLGAEETRFDPRCNLFYNVHNSELNVNCNAGNTPFQTSSLTTGLPSLSSTGLPPQPPRRHRSMLQVEPSRPYLLSPVPLMGSPQRPYTSVNLTLRPASSDPRPPIDIQGCGSSLTYSTASYDPTQGVQSRLQIEIGPGGGSISAVRTRVPAHVLSSQQSLPKMDEKSRSSPFDDDIEVSPSPPQRPVQPMRGDVGERAYTQVLLMYQMERKRKLEYELEREREKLRKLEDEVQTLENQREQPHLHLLPWMKELQKLREDNRKLRVDCECLTREVDLYDNGQVPLGETSEEFYRHINTGQAGPLHLPIAPQTVPQAPSSNFVDPGGGSTNPVGEGPHWTCSLCTFHNHPALDKCEQCEMPRISAEEGETRDIHIHVRQHSFPHRRVIHSWVV